MLTAPLLLDHWSLRARRRQLNEQEGLIDAMLLGDGSD